MKCCRNCKYLKTKMGKVVVDLWLENEEPVGYECSRNKFMIAKREDPGNMEKTVNSSVCDKWEINSKESGIKEDVNFRRIK